MNSFLNTKSNVKKLQLGVSKCHKIHIGKEKKKCPDTYIDEMTLDSQDNVHLIEEVSEERHNFHKLRFYSKLKSLSTREP